MQRLGWILTGFVGLFLFVDGAARLAGVAPYVEGMTKFGYAAWMAPWIGVTLAVSSILMMIPRTAVLGLILVTGYLGGAADAHVRAQDPWFLFPIALGALAWLGLYLREPRLRALI
jgi:DoxX-like family